MKSPGSRPGTVRTLAVATVACAAALLTACGSSTGGAGADVKQTDSGGAITVWVDPPRVPAAKAFQQAHPEIKVTLNQIDGTVGGKSLQQQFAQFNQAGKGWPDAIFFPSNDDIAWASGAQVNYTADLTDLVPDVIKGYEDAVIAPCTIDGKVLRRQLVDTFDRGEQAPVPLIAGFNSGEIRSLRHLLPPVPQSPFGGTPFNPPPLGPPSAPPTV